MTTILKNTACVHGGVWANRPYDGARTVLRAIANRPYETAVVVRNRGGHAKPRYTCVFGHVVGAHCMRPRAIANRPYDGARTVLRAITNRPYETAVVRYAGD